LKQYEENLLDSKQAKNPPTSTGSIQVTRAILKQQAKNYIFSICGGFGKLHY
jgi:hypothetical protein